MARKPKPKRKESKKALEKRREKAYDRMEASIEETADSLRDEGYEVQTIISRNRDKSIDAEIRVMPKRGQDVTDIMIDIKGATEAVPNTWISTGIRYEPRADEEFYIRIRGMSQANAYYQRNTEAKHPTNFSTGIDIIDNMEGRGRKKAQHVMMRLHWNPENAKPEREQGIEKIERQLIKLGE